MNPIVPPPPEGYADWLAQLKTDIASRRQRAALAVKADFPDMRGFSGRNFKYMAFFAEHCPDGQIGQQPVAQLPWFHIVTLLTKLDDAEVFMERAA